MELISWIIAFVIAITVHEAAHAYASDRLGDPTARLMGRLSLNPLVHYDPVGTSLLLGLVIMRALGAPVIPFGWAKPVQFDPYNLKNPRRDSAIISFAGPASNILLAALLSVILRFTQVSYLSTWAVILYPVIILNIALAIFNLVPVHPLDGGKILTGLLPEKESRQIDKLLNRYGMIILLFMIFPTIGGNSLISIVMTPVLNFFLNILIPQIPTV